MIEFIFVDNCKHIVILVGFFFLHSTKLGFPQLSSVYFGLDFSFFPLMQTFNPVPHTCSTMSPRRGSTRPAVSSCFKSGNLPGTCMEVEGIISEKVHASLGHT